MFLRISMPSIYSIFVTLGSSIKFSFIDKNFRTNLHISEYTYQPKFISYPNYNRNLYLYASIYTWQIKQVFHSFCDKRFFFMFDYWQFLSLTPLFLLCSIHGQADNCLVHMGKLYGNQGAGSLGVNAKFEPFAETLTLNPFPSHHKTPKKFPYHTPSSHFWTCLGANFFCPECLIKWVLKHLIIIWGAWCHQSWNLNKLHDFWSIATTFPPLPPLKIVFCTIEA